MEHSPVSTTGLPDTEEAVYRLPTVTEFPARIKLSARADAYLEGLADALVLGVVGVHQLQGGLLAVVLAVDGMHRDELTRLAAYVRRLEYELERLHWMHYNRKTGADWYRAQTAELWRQGSGAAA